VCSWKRAWEESPRVEKDVVLREINMPSSSSASEGVADWEDFESEEEQEAVETVESEGGEE